LNQCYAVGGDLFLSELLSIELPEARNYRVAEWASRERGICLNQRHLDLRIQPLDLSGASGSREASANDDDAGAPLCYRRRTDERNRSRRGG